MTFLYYDLVDSTPLSQRLDEEDWRRCLSEFLRLSNQVIAEQGGQIQGDRGDGSLAYFGFPVTQRISAVQAVRAGLSLVSDSSRIFAELNKSLSTLSGDRIQLRVGIHSGRVVMGEIAGQQRATGFPLALAERLHACAEPNSVILSHETKKLIGERFQVESIGKQWLKGVETPVHCYRAVAENDDREVFRSPLVSRDRELRELKEHWQRSVRGTPVVVLIAGESGIGKSRLISEFRHVISGQDHVRLTWRCEADLSDIAFHPIIAALKKYLLDSTQKSQVDPSMRIRELVPDGHPEETLLSAIHQMLGLPGWTSQADNFPSAEARREAYLNALVDALVVGSRQRSLLLIVEDVQWIDVSTREVLAKLSKSTDSCSILLLMSLRTEDSMSDQYAFATSVMTLSRLPADDAHSLIIAQPGGRELTPESVSEILNRSDGVPLFIEESAFLEIDRQQNSWKLERAPGDLVDIDLPLPPRLIDLLTARLDSLGEARETAGLAATIGREFPLRLLESASELESQAVQQHVRILVDSGLVIRQHRNEETIGRFKHALVRDSAYAMIIKSRRRAYHAQIAQAFESGDFDERLMVSGRLALHHHAAANHDKAFQLWIAAGVQARRHSEQHEAISHFRKAESLIPLLSEDARVRRSPQVLIMHLASVRCHVALDGYSSTEAYRHAGLAEQLALKCGSDLEILNARFCRVSWLFANGRIDDARRLASDCLQHAESAFRKCLADEHHEARDALEFNLARANWACGNIDFHRASFDQAIVRIDRCIDLCRQLKDVRRHTDQDPLIMCLCYRSWYEWESGDADRALRTVREAVSLASESARAFGVALSLAFQAAVHLFRGEYKMTVDSATQSISISKASRYVAWHAWALVLKGRAQCQLQTDRQAGIEQIEEGLRLWQSSGTVITRPFMLTQLAESCALDGQSGKALQALEEAISMVDRYGDRYHEAAIVCAQARILATTTGSGHQRQDIAALLRRSIEIAEAYGQFSTALAAEIELYRLTGQTPESSHGVARLRTAFTRMKSGLETRIPRIAKTLLQHVDMRE